MGLQKKKPSHHCIKNVLWQTALLYVKHNNVYVRFEVFMAVTMKNGVFWDVMPCGSCKNRRFGGT
jgi:hypothetical protein